MSENILPKHVAIIMDGNGRWAVKNGNGRSYGHRIGRENVDRIIAHAFKKGVYALTLFAFSSENWARPKNEVDELMGILKTFFESFVQSVDKSDVRLIVVGERDGLSEGLKKAISDAEEKSKGNNGHVLSIALNYGGRQEIVEAVKKTLENGEEISAQSISKNLYTAIFGDPDLIIRTGGEQRLSNFLLFQSAYSEFYFTDVLWPDFDEKEFDKAIDAFGKRVRRFGGV